MIKLLNENLAFDTNKIIIIKGKENIKIYKEEINEYPDVKVNKDKNWKPTITYLSSITCNLKCKYCYANNGTYNFNNTQKFFSFKSYKKIFEILYQKFDGIKAISFFGGEPMLNFIEIKKFIEYLFENYEKDKIPRLSINTNMTIMNEEIKELILKYNINIGSSIDGLKEQNNFYRKSDFIKDIYDEVSRNLKIIKNCKGLKIVQCTISNKHVKNYKKGSAIKFIKDLENQYIDMYELIPVESDDTEIKIDLNNSNIYIKYEQMCLELIKYYLDILKNNNKPMIPNMVSSIILAILKRTYINDCTAGGSITVTPDEKIYPCHMFCKRSELGLDINNIKFQENFVNNNFFKLVRESNRRKNKICKSCLCVNICGIWCKGFSYINHGDFSHVSEARCIMMNIFSKEIIKFLAYEFENNCEVIMKNLQYIINKNEILL